MDTDNTPKKGDFIRYIKKDGNDKIIEISSISRYGDGDDIFINYGIGNIIRFNSDTFDLEPKHVWTSKKEVGGANAKVANQTKNPNANPADTTKNAKHIIYC